MWVKSPMQILGAEQALLSSFGVYIFGGQNHRKEASNDLYILQPALERNKKYISSKNNGNFKKLIKPKLYYTLQKV